MKTLWPYLKMKVRTRTKEDIFQKYHVAPKFYHLSVQSKYLRDLAVRPVVIAVPLIPQSFYTSG